VSTKRTGHSTIIFCNRPDVVMQDRQRTYLSTDDSVLYGQIPKHEAPLTELECGLNVKAMVTPAIKGNTWSHHDHFVFVRHSRWTYQKNRSFLAQHTLSVRYWHNESLTANLFYMKLWNMSHGTWYDSSSWTGHPVIRWERKKHQNNHNDKIVLLLREKIT